MSLITTIIQKELKSFFTTPIGYVILAVFLGLTSWLFMLDFFVVAQVSLRQFFQLLPYTFLILAPALAMRSFAEEKKTGTWETLLTLPITDTQLVLGKILSLTAVLAITLISSIAIPLVISRLGPLDWGAILAGYLASFLLGTLFLSLSVFVSSLTQNQVVSFLVSVVFSLVLVLVGQEAVTNQFPAIISQAFQVISPLPHYWSLVRGVISLADLVYFISFTAFWAYLTVKSLASRHYL